MCNSEAEGGQRCATHTRKMLVRAEKKLQAATEAVITARQVPGAVRAPGATVAGTPEAGDKAHRAYRDAKLARMCADEEARAATEDHAFTPAGRTELMARVEEQRDLGNPHTADRTELAVMKADLKRDFMRSAAAFAGRPVAPGETLQSGGPLARLPANSGQEPVLQVALNESLVLDASFQRGSVWGPRRQRALIRSLLSGVSVGNVYINDRGFDKNIGDQYVVVDGRQRIEAIRAFHSGQLSVPASWFKPKDVTRTESTPDGPYVRYPDLEPVGKAMFDRTSITTQRSSLPTVEQETALFETVNFAGLQQGQVDPPEGY